MKAVACFCLFLLLNACSGVDSAAVDSSTMNLKQTRQAWLALGLSSYQYDIQRQCFCTPEYTRAMRVRVENGVVSSATYIDDQTAVAKKVVKNLYTIEQWFDRIEKGYQKPYFRIDVIYEPQAGYPTKISIDRSEHIADDEESVAISNVSGFR